MNDQINPSKIEPSSEKTGGRELMYALGQAIFAPMGPALAEMGWSVIPQERGERRLPSKVDGETLKWSPFQWKAAEPAVTRRWAMFAPGANVAVLYGKGSGNTFGIDGDISDPRKSWDIQKIAERILGKTPFHRVGRQPKFLLTYRTADGELPRSTGYRLIDAGDDQVEILAQGKVATFYGLHHKTGNYFKWIGPQPYMHGPEFATLVTRKQIQEFLDELSEKKYITLPYTGAPISNGVEDLSIELIRSGNLVYPDDKFARKIKGIRLDDNNDLVVAGRTNCLVRDLSLFYVKNNHELVKTADGELKLTSALCSQVRRLVARTGKWSTDWMIDKRVQEQTQRDCRRVRDGLLKVAPVIRYDETTGESQRMIVPAAYQPLDVDVGDDLKALLPPVDQRTPLKFDRETTKTVAADELKRRVSERALLATDADRKQASDKVSLQIRSNIKTFMSGEGNMLMMSPTGAGKSTTTYRAAVEYVYEGKLLGADRGGVVFLLPSHAVISEGVEKTKDYDAETAALAKYARSKGLKVEVLSGKLTAGCLNPALALLMEAGIGSAKLCKSAIFDPITKETNQVECSLAPKCPVKALWRRIAEADIIFAPHAYMTVQIPVELKERAKKVIIDERIYTGLIRSTDDHKFPHLELVTLEDVRPGPRPNKLEKGWDEEGLTLEVKTFNDLILNAIKGADKLKSNPIREIEQALLAHEVTMLDDTVQTGSMLCDHVRSIIGRLMDGRDLVRPNITLAEVKDIIEKRSKLPQLMQHRQLAIILHDRIKELEEDRAAQRLRTGNEPVSYKPKAKGDHDARLQLVTWMKFDDNGQTKEVRGIRLAWRLKRNFEGIPHLFLDASGDEEIMSKLFDGVHKLNVVRIGAKLHMRTVALIDSNFSNMSLIPKLAKSDALRIAATQVKIGVRDMLNTVSLYFGKGRVISATNICVMNDLFGRWREFENLDQMYNGKLTGFNFAENHLAAVAVGRMELPPRAIDAMVAALTYDDEKPETPLDYNGNGLDANGKEIKTASAERRVQARDGLDVKLTIPMHSGRWAQRVQRQFREEQIRQFIGRLRPVYRQGEAPICFIAARCIPEDIIVDEFISLKDMRRPVGAKLDIADAVRQYGVLDEEVLAEAGLADPQGIRADIARLPKGLVDNAFACYDYEVDGERKPTRVHLSVSDPEQAIIAAQRLRGRDAEDVRLLSTPPVVPSGRAPRGRFDDLGTRQERHDLWLADREKAVDAAGDRLVMGKVDIDMKTLTPIAEWHELVLQGLTDEIVLIQMPKPETAEPLEEIPF